MCPVAARHRPASVPERLTSDLNDPDLEQRIERAIATIRAASANAASAPDRDAWVNRVTATSPDS
jgi:hypothetical protein